MTRLAQIAAVGLLFLLAVPSTRAAVVGGVEDTLLAMQQGTRHSVERIVGFRR